MRGILRTRVLRGHTQYASHHTCGKLSPRQLHTTRTIAKDEAANSTVWPTAESVILQRISSTSIHPSLAHLKTDKGAQTESSPAGTEQPDGNRSEDAPQGESLTVSGLISSLRESRGAVKDYTDKETAGSKEQDTPGSNEQVTTGSKKQVTTGPKEQGEYHIPYCLFNTHSLVRQLTDVGFSNEQATLLMTLVKYKVYESMEQLKASMLTKSDLENDAYLFRAALQELRTETQMIRKNDQAILESRAAAINRDIESLAQRLTDEVANLRSDIEIEINNHKHDSIHEMKSLDMELHRLASNYQIVLGEMKTDIETIKLESIRRGLLAAVVTTMALLAIIWGPELVSKLNMRRRQKDGKGSEDKSDVGNTGNGEGRAGASLPMRMPEVGPGMAGYVDPGRASLRYGSSNARYGTTQVPGQQSYGPEPYRLHRGRDAEPAEGYGSSGDQGMQYRDHSHLNIQYDPTISASESQFGEVQQPPSPAESDTDYALADWFDTYFYSPQVIAQRRSDSGESASLVDTDPTFDSARWRARDDQSQTEPTFAPESNPEPNPESEPERQQEQNQQEQSITHIPINFSNDRR
ncbi:hypothetical protein GGH12_002883 [Coemansia sp. RSA 1822]|nr:hypothetical protein LPJ76_002341 [Coemansia sp. RSA 638]KAJ2541157.1 hypothetical protein GGF49_003883 [Coemansia sp. RSA 1853]KAJ2562908.1 hypothetical protein GGH12_002883 [Coemansia sp. RSA 1822]